MAAARRPHTTTAVAPPRAGTKRRAPSTPYGLLLASPTIDRRRVLHRLCRVDPATRAPDPASRTPNPSPRAVVVATIGGNRRACTPAPPPRVVVRAGSGQDVPPPPPLPSWRPPRASGCPSGPYKSSVRGKVDPNCETIISNLTRSL